VCANKTDVYALQSISEQGYQPVTVPAYIKDDPVVPHSVGSGIVRNYLIRGLILRPFDLIVPILQFLFSIGILFPEITKATTCNNPHRPKIIPNLVNNVQGWEFTNDFQSL
jgi:hypothetical protein